MSFIAAVLFFFSCVHIHSCLLIVVLVKRLWWKHPGSDPPVKRAKSFTAAWLSCTNFPPLQFSSAVLFQVSICLNLSLTAGIGDMCKELRTQISCPGGKQRFHWWCFGQNHLTENQPSDHRARQSSVSYTGIAAVLHVKILVIVVTKVSVFPIKKSYCWCSNITIIHWWCVSGAPLQTQVRHSMLYFPGVVPQTAVSGAISLPEVTLANRWCSPSLFPLSSNYL